MPISSHGRQFALDPQQVLELGKAFLESARGRDTTTVEAACVFTYANVAPAIRAWDPLDRDRRANVFMKLALERLVDTLFEVQAMHERELALVEIADRAGLRSTMGSKPS